MESTMAGMERRPMGQRRPRRQVIGCPERIGCGPNRRAVRKSRSTTRPQAKKFANDGTKRTGSGRGDLKIEITGTIRGCDRIEDEAERRRGGRFDLLDKWGF